MPWGPDPLLVAAPVLAPLLAMLGIAAPSLLASPPSEATVARAAHTASTATLIAALLTCARVGAWGPVRVDLGRWYGDAEYALELVASLDATSAAASLVIAVYGAVSLRFAEAYLHREPGHGRFFGVTLLALASLQVIAMAGTLDVLFAGWELLGLCSFLLIAFFHEREETVVRGLRAAFNTRVADLGLLLGLILLHDEARSSAIGPGAAATPGTAVGVLLLVTAAGKSGMAPFTGWLARSAEGPTPSTALFYGGLSVCAGPWLLLRAWPLYGSSVEARAALVAVGAVTALASSLAARTRSDIKGAVILAGGAQIGLVAAEIGLGLHTLAGAHLLGNLALRTWQLLRAPSAMELARARARQLGRPLPAPRPIATAAWLLGTAGGLEPLVVRLVAALMALARGLDAVSRRLEQMALRPGGPS